MILEHIDNKPKFIPSKYQAAIDDAFVNTDANILINSVAGSGKTTTIVNLCEKIPSNRFAIFVAFNRAIAAELRSKIPERIAVKTLHANGLNELRFKYFRQPGVTNDNFIDEGKIGKIIMSRIDRWNEWGDDDEGQAERASYATRVERIVNTMRFSLETDTKKIQDLCYKYDIDLSNGEIAAAREVLGIADADCRTFDFVDMIYRPAVGSWKLKQFHYVLVDEGQDMNRAQQEMIKNRLKSCVIIRIYNLYGGMKI